MIVCNKCNHQNGDNETFCASCGAFLAWDGTRVAEPPPPPSEPEPVVGGEPDADPSRPGLIQRVKAVVLDQGQAAPGQPEGSSHPGFDPAAPGGWSPTPPPAAPPPAMPPPPAPGEPWGGPSQPPPGATAWSAPPTVAPPPAPPPPPAPAAPPAPPAPGPPAGGGTWATPPAPSGGGQPAAPPAPPAGPPPSGPDLVPSAPAASGADPAPAEIEAPPGAAGELPAPASPSGPEDAGGPPAGEPAPLPPDPVEVVPGADAAALIRQEAENNRRYAAERARLEAEAAEREAFKKRQAAAAALFEQPLPSPAPTPVPGTQPAPADSGRWGPAPVPTPPPSAPDAPIPPSAPPGAPAAPVLPAAQLPGAAEAKRFAPRPVVQHAPPKAGDLVCGSCGAGNNPDRKFCRQCGASLVAAVVEPKMPWWKRLFSKSKRKVPPPRPTGPGHPTKRTQRKRATRRALGYLRMGLALIAVAGVLGIAAVPALRTRFTEFTSCKSRQLQALVKPPVKNVALTNAAASQELPDHPAVKAFDSNPATFWQAPPPPAAAVPPAAAPQTPPQSPPQADPQLPITLNVQLAGPSTVRQIHFFPGLPKANNPNSQPSPKVIELTFRNERGATVGSPERFTLDTNVSKDDQLLKLKAKKEVTSMEVAILEVYDSPTGGNQVAIGDVQLFGSPAQAPGEKCAVG